MIDILDQPLFRAIIDRTIPFYEIMNSFGIRVTIGNLPTTVAGFTYRSKKGYYHLILNANLSYETQCRTFMHEIKHIACDMPEMSYIVGLDMQRSSFEYEADKFAEVVGLGGYIRVRQNPK